MLALFIIHWNVSDIIPLAILVLIVVAVVLVTVSCIFASIASSVWKKVKTWWRR